MPEAGEKPQSTLGFHYVDETTKKIATSLVVSDEALDDVPELQALINGQLVSFVQLATEEMLLRGAGGNEIEGLLTRGVPIYGGGTAEGTRRCRSSRR